MKKILFVICLSAFYMSTSIAIAADKVVVIPLRGGNKCTSPTENNIINSIGMTFNLISVGTFTMGSPDTEPGRLPEESEHQVTLTKPFYIQTTEVTQGQWQEVIGNNPAFYNRGENYPIESVNWFEAAYFANSLSQSEGRSKCYVLTDCTNTPGNDMECTGVSIKANCTGYRLPTEAEWEFSARAGTNTAYAKPCNFDENVTEIGLGFNSNLASMGWYAWNNTNGGYISGTKPVTQKQPNSWGLYDMHGNVHEWCQDWRGDYPTGSVTDPMGPLVGDFRLFRGGNWSLEARSARSAGLRYNNKPGSIFLDLGFRLVLSKGE